MTIDWHALLVPSGSLLEIMLRGTVMYVGLVLLFRFLRREAGSWSLADLLLIVLISDAAQNGMAGEYRSLTEGLVLVGTIAAWSYLIDWLSFRYKAFARILQAPPLPLIRNGVLQHRNLRRELITSAELHSQLRQKGVEHIEDVRCCYLEPDGQLSVVEKTKKKSRSKE